MQSGTSTGTSSVTHSSSPSLSATASPSLSDTATPSPSLSDSPIPLVLNSAAPSDDGGSARISLSVAVQGISNEMLSANGGSLGATLQLAVSEASGVTHGVTSVAWRAGGVGNGTAAGGSATPSPLWLEGGGGGATASNGTSPTVTPAANATAAVRRQLQASISQTVAADAYGSSANVTADTSVEVDISMEVTQTDDWSGELLSEAGGDAAALGLANGTSTAQRRTLLLAVVVSRVRRILVSGNSTRMQAFSAAAQACTGLAPSFKVLASSVAYEPVPVQPGASHSWWSTPGAAAIILGAVMGLGALAAFAAWRCLPAAGAAAGHGQRLAIIVPVPRCVRAGAADASAASAAAATLNPAASVQLDATGSGRRSSFVFSAAATAAAAATPVAPAAAAPAAAAASAAVVDALIARKQAAVDAQVAHFTVYMPTFLSSTAVQPPLSGHHIFFVEHEVPVTDGDAAGPVMERATFATGASRGAALNAGFLLATDAASRHKCGLPDMLAQHGFSAFCFHDLALLPQGAGADDAPSSGAVDAFATPSDAEAGRWYAANPAYGPLHIGGLWEQSAGRPRGLAGAVTLTAEAVHACNGFPNVTGFAGANTELLGRLQLAGRAGTVQRPGAQAAAAEAHGPTDVEAGGAGSQSGPADPAPTAHPNDGVASCRFMVTEARPLSDGATVLRIRLLLAGPDDAEPIQGATTDAAPAEDVASSAAARATATSASAEGVALDLKGAAPCVEPSTAAPNSSSKS